MSIVTHILTHLNAKFTMTEAEKNALGLMIESVIKPDSKLRGCAYNQDCYDELMVWRQKMLDLLYSYEKNDVKCCCK